MEHSPQVSSLLQMPTQDPAGNLGYTMAVLALSEKQAGGRTALCYPSLGGQQSPGRRACVRGRWWVQGPSSHRGGEPGPRFLVVRHWDDPVAQGSAVYHGRNCVLLMLPTEDTQCFTVVDGL